VLILLTLLILCSYLLLSKATILGHRKEAVGKITQFFADPALNGAATQGETLEEAREMTKDLIIGYLEALATF
jgi:hypothetical protein